MAFKVFFPKQGRIKGLSFQKRDDSTLRHRPRTTTHPPPRARRRARFARTNPFPTPNSHRDGSSAFARVSSGAIELRAILSGCASTRTTKTLFSSIQSFPGGARLFAPNFWDDGTADDEIVDARTDRASRSTSSLNLQKSSTRGREGERATTTAEREREREKTSNRTTQSRWKKELLRERRALTHQEDEKKKSTLPCIRERRSSRRRTFRSV